MSENNSSINFFDEIPPRAQRDQLESPIELMFIEALEKYLAPKTKIFPQFEVRTLAGKFRLDFLITINDKKVGIECDGEDFHDEWRDEWRDALILGSRKIDTIYRFRGKDIFTSLNDCIYVIFMYDPDLFNNRYFINSKQLISEGLKEYIVNSQFSITKETNIICHEEISEEGHRIGWLRMVVERRNKDNSYGHWNVLFEIAKKNPGLKLEELMEIRRQEINLAFK